MNFGACPPTAESDCIHFTYLSKKPSRFNKQHFASLNNFYRSLLAKFLRILFARGYCVTQCAPKYPDHLEYVHFILPTCGAWGTLRWTPSKRQLTKKHQTADSKREERGWDDRPGKLGQQCHQSG